MKNVKKVLFLLAVCAITLSFGKVNAKAADYNGANKQWTTLNETGYNSANYIRYRAPYTGRLVVYAQNISGGINLCNSSKRIIASEYGSYSYVSSTSSYSYNRSVTFGVKKGVTYYIRVVGYSSVSDRTNPMYEKYSIMPVTTKVSEKSGSKRTKAKTIKKGKTKKGTIIAGSSTKDWYKFKLTKRKAVKFYLNGDTNDTIKLSFYKGGKYIDSCRINRGYSTIKSSKRYAKTSGKWPKGTYYIKVEKSKASSGWYQIKWK